MHKCILLAGGGAVLKALPKICGASSSASPRPPTSSKNVSQKETASVIKRLPEVKYDELEQIAAIIAGAGVMEEEVKNLADAVKGNGLSKTKKGKK